MGVMVTSMLKLNPKERPDIFGILDMIDTSLMSEPDSDSSSDVHFESPYTPNDHFKPEYEDSSTDSVFDT